MKTIGMTTIGQSPRDDLVPYMEESFSRRVTVLQRGALDGLTRAEIAGLAPRPGQGTLVTRLVDGSEVTLSYEAVLPRMQAAVDELIARGAELLVVLCGADWSALRSALLIVNPGHAKRLWRALGENISRYEAQFGPIREAPQPTPEPSVGFVQ